MLTPPSWSRGYMVMYDLENNAVIIGVRHRTMGHKVHFPRGVTLFFRIPNFTPGLPRRDAIIIAFLRAIPSDRAKNAVFLIIKSYNTRTHTHIPYVNTLIYIRRRCCRHEQCRLLLSSNEWVLFRVKGKKKSENKRRRRYGRFYRSSRKVFFLYPENAITTAILHGEFFRNNNGLLK